MFETIQAELRKAQSLGETVAQSIQLVRPSRRSMLQFGGAAAVFALAARITPANAYVPYDAGANQQPGNEQHNPLTFVSIAEDGAVTLVAHRPEMGTGARTSTPMIMADEMEADWSRVKIVQAEGDEPKYGNQNNDGSRTIRHFVQPMRIVGASVRQMLEAAAAKRWGVEPKFAKAKMHDVYRLKDDGGNLVETGEKLGYGELAKEAMALTPPPVEKVNFKADADFRYMGKGQVHIYDLRDITVGKGRYGADYKFPGMKYAVIARPPVLGAPVKSVDDSAALKTPGVEKVVQLPVTGLGSAFAPKGGVAVIANSTYAAIQGRDALKVEWGDSPHSVLNDAPYEKDLSAAVNAPGKVIRKKGDFDAALASAAKTVSAEYYQPHFAHATMEPLCANADATADSVHIYASVQNPYLCRQDAAKASGIAIENVHVYPTLLGGGFGRKSQHDFAIEAVLLSKAIGAPVRVQWTREDDIRHPFAHAASVSKLDASVDASGKVTGWRHRTAGPSILSTFAPDSGYQFPLEYGLGFINQPFDVANMQLENGKAPAHVRIAWFRSVNNVQQAFAQQSFIGEIAAALNRDPKDMLLEMIGAPGTLDLAKEGLPADFFNYDGPKNEFPIDRGRLANVVKIAAQNANWGRKLPKGEALGIAAHYSFLSYVASVVHVKIGDDGTISVPEVFTAVDAGFTVNPERIESQMQGAAVMGMTIAMYSGLSFKDGAIQESNFNDYPLARMKNYPQNVNVHIVKHPFSSYHAGGVGEPGVPPFAPALANAIATATGKRLRKLPFGDNLA
jgi:isoquinoline 1-oxidoreductase beta subunit